MRTLDNVVAGAVGGLAAGLVMTAFMTAGKQTGMIEEPLPLKYERKLEDLAGIEQRPGETQAMVLSQGEHLLFSAALGAGCGALSAALDLPAIPAGPPYGLGVYALMLGAVGPAMDITAGPWNEEPLTAGRRVMMHLVYGTVTAVVAEQVRQER
ncbi:MAG: hypothetical protein M3R24_11310 [Chloroflexota bacterium]|nr:hypothetical protein [Chloroflexota bacterium]